MDLLGGYGSDDSDARSEDGAGAAVDEDDEGSAEDQDEDEDEDSDEDAKAAAAQEAKKKKVAAARAAKRSLLPSVDDMLSGGGPSFLAAPKQDDNYVAPTKKVRLYPAASLHSTEDRPPRGMRIPSQILGRPYSLPFD